MIIISLSLWQYILIHVIIIILIIIVKVRLTFNERQIERNKIKRLYVRLNLFIRNVCSSYFTIRIVLIINTLLAHKIQFIL